MYLLVPLNVNSLISKTRLLKISRNPMQARHLVSQFWLWFYQHKQIKTTHAQATFQINYPQAKPLFKHLWCVWSLSCGSHVGYFSNLIYVNSLISNILISDISHMQYVGLNSRESWLISLCCPPHPSPVLLLEESSCLFIKWKPY